MNYDPHQDFTRQFVERTLQILKQNKGNTEYESTLFINCLLGLIALPFEKCNINNKLISKDLLKAIKMNLYSDNSQAEQIDLWDIIRYLRNSVCHGGIEFNPEQLYPDKKPENIQGVRFTCYDNYDNETNIIMEIDLLERFAITFAEAILEYKHINNKI